MVSLVLMTERAWLCVCNKGEEHRSARRNQMERFSMLTSGWQILFFCYNHHKLGDNRPQWQCLHDVMVDFFSSPLRVRWSAQKGLSGWWGYNHFNASRINENLTELRVTTLSLTCLQKWLTISGRVQSLYILHKDVVTSVILAALWCRRALGDLFAPWGEDEVRRQHFLVTVGKQTIFLCI